MKELFMWLKLGFSFACGSFSYIFGGIDAFLQVLVIMMVIDYITGVCAAIYKKQLCSQKGFNGILKKTAILCVVACAHLIGVAMGMGEIRSAVIGFYIANEGISIIENAAALGVPMPKKLIDILENLKKKEDADDL